MTNESWHPARGVAVDLQKVLTPEVRERVRRTITRIRAEVGLFALEVPDATMTRSGRLLRRRVLDPLSHEEFRAMVRATRPTFGRARSDHASGMGYDVASAEARAGRPVFLCPDRDPSEKRR